MMRIKVCPYTRDFLEFPEIRVLLGKDFWVIKSFVTRKKFLYIQGGDDQDIEFLNSILNEHDIRVEKAPQWWQRPIGWFEKLMHRLGA